MSMDQEFVDRSINEFRTRFRPRLGHRADSFEIALSYYFQNCDRRPVIVETGTARDRGNWSGDGQSTLIWDFACQQHENGQGVSIDISNEYVKTAAMQCSESMSFVTADSVYGLASLDASLLDLTGILYLDSFDLDVQQPWPAAMHALKELAAVYARLPDDCLIIVDDCFNEKVGKHFLVAEFLKQTDARVIFRGYQHIWSKV